MPAPFLIAKERGELAERLLGIARKHGIEILYDESLAESLFYLETGSYIPESLYDAVATLLAYVYRTRSES
jgi:flagellar biosynthesis protein